MLTKIASYVMCNIGNISNANVAKSLILQTILRTFTCCDPASSYEGTAFWVFRTLYYMLLN